VRTIASKSRLWHWPDVAHWSIEHRKAKIALDAQTAELIAAMNAAFDLREHAGHLHNKRDLALVAQALGEERRGTRRLGRLRVCLRRVPRVYPVHDGLPGRPRGRPSFALLTPRARRISILHRHAKYAGPLQARFGGPQVHFADGATARTCSTTCRRPAWPQSP
jgi:hypothetical protein